MRRFLALSLAGTLAFAQTPDYSRDEFPKLPGLLWDDAKGVAASPKDWTASDWKQVGLGAAAVLGVALALDKTIDDAALRNGSPSRDRVARGIAQLGGNGGLILMGAGYFGFSLLDMDEPRSIVVEMGIATVLAQTAILPLKLGVGRARPVDGLGASHFTSFSSRDSFPSGHATQAFAMASVISMRSTEPWVGICAYGAASLVAVSRLETRAHFASDVLAGALVGTLVGRTVVSIDRGVRSRVGKAEIKISPALAPDFKGVTISAKF